MCFWWRKEKQEPSTTSAKQFPGLMELHQDDQYRLAVGNAPEIWRPLDISVWGAWKHIGTDKSWS